MERIFNHYNSSIESLELENAKQEILDNFYDFLDNVPFIRYMVNPLRPTAKDLPKDESGKIIVDVTKPHILEDMDYFRPSALHYIKYGTYTNLRPNPNPNSEFGKWIREETRRCYEGYVRPSDGEWVTGDYYFFLNYCPMLVSQKVDGTNKAIRTESFPSVWDGHYLMSHYLEQARNKGKQAAALSSRGRGKSYWGAGMLSKRFVLGVGKDGESRKRTSFILASDTSKLVAGDQTLDKFQYDIDFIKENMQWPSMRLTDALQKMQWKMGYVDLNTGTKKGTLNSVVGFSVVDEAKIRGSRGDLFLFEEAGCHLKGTKVLMNDSSIKNVEDIKVGDLLMGDDGTPRKVLELHSGIDDMYKITLSNGDTQIVNSKHLIYFKKYDWYRKTYTEYTLTPKEVMSIPDLNKGYYILKSNKVSYEYKKPPFSPYWLGLWLGDGDKSHMAVSNEDIEVLDWIENYCKDNKFTYTKHFLPQSKNCYNIYITSKNAIWKIFKSLNLVNNKHIPDIFKYNSKEVLLEILAGVIDTDGTLDKRRQNYEITQVYKNKKIIDDLRFICNVLGFKTSLTTRINSPKSKGADNLNYRLRISGDIDKIPVKIHRKQLIKRNTKRNRRNWNEYTFKVEYWGKGEFYGFTVDKNHLFLLEDFTIVHNSFPKLLSTYNNLIPSVKEGDNVYGQIFLYGCVCAGTIVYKDNGEPVKIEDVKLNDTLLGYNGNNTSVEHISWRNPEAYKECVEITTEGNKKIRCSIDHPLLAFNKKVFKSGSRLDKSCSFYLANELKVGDSLLMPKTIGTFGIYNEPDAYLLGALFGDGSFSGNQCVTLSICTKEEYAYYSSKYDLGISKLSKGDNTYAQLYFRKLHPLLKKYGMDKKAFGKKTFPNNIYEWDKESVCNFLGGYFNADGNVQITKVKHRTIKLTSKYEEHLLMVQSLLNKLGITSYILKEHKKASILHSKTNNRIYEMKETDCFVLYINNSEDIITFRENIKFIIKKKQERLDSYNVNHNNTYNDIKFILRDNHKGKNFEGTSFNNIRKATIKSIKSIGIQRIYNMTADTTHTYISNNFISSNTSGDSDSDFQSMQEIMYNPEGYDVYGIDNVYDKEGFGKRKFTFFFPEYLNRAGCYDNNGNSDVTKALFEIISERVKVKYNSSDIRTILKTISDRPIVPQEAIMRVKGNFFPITDINNRIAQLDANPSEYDDVYIGKIIFNKDNKPEFQPTTDTPIRDFPLKNENTKGAIEIFKLPEKDANGNVFNNRYIAGLDPIDDDSSNDSLHSLMSLFVLDLWTDSVVCEYTGRLEFADDQYEIIRKILLFFNARCLYENNKKGIYAYFAKMNSLYLLEETPEFLKEKDMIKTVGIGNKAVGFSANKAVNDYADRCTRNWLMQPVTIISEVDGKEEESTVYKLYTVKNRAFLRECSLFNPDINVDRIRAFGALMLSREQHLIYNNGELKRNEDKVEKDYLGNDDYFTNNYDRRNSIK